MALVMLGRYALSFAMLCAAGVGPPLVNSVRADEAPTILIEDVILNCTSQAPGLAMPSAAPPEIDTRRLERRLHRRIAELCQGQMVCRIGASTLLDPDIRASTCDDLVLVPVCAIGAFESLTPDTSLELSLPLRPEGYLVINCSGRASPHF